MNARRNRRLLAAIAVMIVTCIVVSVQPQDTGDGEWVSFPNTTIGQTQTVPFTYTLLESSATSALITVSPPLSPFGVGEPLSFTLNPGDSRTLNLTFSPTEAGSYEGSLSISALGGIPPRVKTTYVTLMGTGVAGPSVPGLWNPFVEVEPTSDSSELGLLEVKLDRIDAEITDIKADLDFQRDWTAAVQMLILQTLGADLTSLGLPSLPSFGLAPDPSLTSSVGALETKIDALGIEVEDWLWVIDAQLGMLEGKADIQQKKAEAIEEWLMGIEAKLDNLAIEIDKILGNAGPPPTGIAGILANQANLLAGQGNLLLGQGNIVGSAGPPPTGINGVLANQNAILGEVGPPPTGLQALGMPSYMDQFGNLHPATGLFSELLGVEIDVGEVQNALTVVNGNAIAAIGQGRDCNEAISEASVKIDANTAAIGQVSAAMGTSTAQLASKLDDNAALIAENAEAIRSLSEMIEALQVVGEAPAGPNLAKITLTVGGGPVPDAPLTATVKGAAGAVPGRAIIKVYWPYGVPSILSADPDGMFSISLQTGDIAYNRVSVAVMNPTGSESDLIEIAATP